MTFTVINASAGSGKTYTLTHSLADRIAAGLDPSQIIATTFTVKAAQELAGRIRSTLLDRRQVEEARGIDSALIGTVNSVAGQLVTEYALDAGISPDVQVLDADAQKAAFTAAISRTAATAGATRSDLLARTSHDGAEDDTFSRKQAWMARVRDVADVARTNLLDADALRAAVDASWQAYREAAELPDPVPDQRPRWLHELEARIADLAAQLEAGEVASRSVNKTQNDLSTLRSLHRTLARHDRAPWETWVKIADGAFGAVAKKTLAPLSAEITEALPADAAWQRDVRDLMELVLGTAAHALEDYARFKADLGLIDFIDQEVQALRLLQTSPRVRASVASRFRLLAVDEFQDTSPVQLALFLELSQLIEDKIWVGDPKQAIYGFRDADPRLMQDIITALESGGTVFGQGEVTNLSESWRSAARLVDFSNAVFTPVFAQIGMPPERVRLAIPAQRATKAEGGCLEVWEAQKSRGGVLSTAKHAAMIAEQLRVRIEDGTMDPGRTAVLVRKGSERDAVIAALQARGVPVAGAAHALRDTREAQIIRAGLSAVLDASDTLALTELVVLLEDHSAHDTWFADLMAAEDRNAVFAAWWQDDALAGLRRVRRACIGFTPQEMIQALIDALDLPQRIKQWSEQSARRRSLDALLALAARSAEHRRAEGAPVTLSGLRADLDAWEDGPDLEDLPDAVWVGTIHAAKGLEWDHVVTYLPAKAKTYDHSWGVLVRSPDGVDVTAPLHGRDLLFWPKLAVPAETGEHLASSAFAAGRAARETEEAARVHYVGLTRAARTGVLAAAGSRTVLNDLIVDRVKDGATELVRWTSNDLRVAGSAEPIPAEVTAVNVDDLVAAPPRHLAPRPDLLAATDVPLRPAGPARERIAARFQASAVASADALGTVAAPRRIGRVLVAGGGPQWERVGEAIHSYLALPLKALTPQQKQASAQRLVERWMVARTVDAAVLREAGDTWHAFLAAEFPDAEVLTEQPISWWNDDAQVMEGWIDTLLRLPDGRIVLVDHKSYPGQDPVSHVRAHYLGQLHTYAQALAAAGLNPDRILIHLPLRGEVLEVTLHGGTAPATAALTSPMPDMAPDPTASSYQEPDPAAAPATPAPADDPQETLW